MGGMFSNWKPKLGTIVGFFGTVFGILQFFGISAKEIGQFMTANYLWLAVATGSFALFVWGCYAWWKSSRVTPENIHAKIREWLDSFSLNHRIMPWEPWHFRYDVTLWDHVIFVGRPKAGGRYLHIEIRTFGVRQEHAETYAALTPFDKGQFEANLALEIARAKISFYRHQQDFSDVSITAQLPITPKLSSMDFYNAILEAYMGAVLVWNVIALKLAKSPELTPPSLTRDTEASPPKPT